MGVSPDMADIADICRVNLACSCIGEAEWPVCLARVLGDAVHDADCTEGGEEQGGGVTFPV